MKTFIVFIATSILFVSHSYSELPPDFHRIEAEQVALWEQKLREARMSPPETRTAQLWRGLRNMAHRKSFEVHSPDVEVIFQKIQDELLSIPGHARYFFNELKREQIEVEQFPTNTGPRVSYDFHRGLYFLTMRHLPSPETIAVLGEFLSDDKDAPGPLDQTKSYDYDIPPANSEYSATTISHIGLREPPASKDSYDADPETHLAKTRAWWEEVKAGKRTFSFKGQAVEYRFKPDGTWDTIPISNPPDDRTQPSHETPSTRPVKRPGAVLVDAPEPPAGHAWWWYGVGGIALLVLGAWFMRKKTVG
jgi:hypothetical protein